MLKIMAGATGGFDERTQEFVGVGGTPLELEHSLVSLSKWEQEFEKPFLGKDEKSPDEVVAYVRAMTLTEGVSAEVYAGLSQQNFEAINDYIDRKMTATFFYEAPGQPKSREVITSELVYYWLTVYQIPFECETWHLNRLFTLIRICNVKQSKPKKMGRGEAAEQRRQLNAQRQKQFNTKG